MRTLLKAPGHASPSFEKTERAPVRPRHRPSPIRAEEPRERPGPARASGLGHRFADVAISPPGGDKPPPIETSRHSSPRATAPKVIQRFEDELEATRGGVRFKALHAHEEKLTGKINTLLGRYNDSPDATTWNEIKPKIEKHRQALKDVQGHLTGLMKKYESADGTARRAFLNETFGDVDLEAMKKSPARIVKGRHDVFGAPESKLDLRLMFGSLFNRTESGPDEDESYRHRFLANTLQSMRDPIGANRVANLLNKLGSHRKIKVFEGVQHDLSAGLERDEDLPHSRHTGQEVEKEEIRKYQEQDESLPAYLREKYGTGRKRRPANPKAYLIHDARVNMDKNAELLPIFGGLKGGRPQLFTMPKYMQVHHELGHLVTHLEGRAGSHKRTGSGMGPLTSDEEEYNIYGGPRSDYEYTGLKGLPRRMMHKVLTTFMPGHFGTGHGAMQELTALSYQHHRGKTDLAMELLQQIGATTGKDWSAHTKGWRSRPTGVGKIRDKVTSRRGDALTALREIQQLAHTSHGQTSKKRQQVTTDFYSHLAGLDPTKKKSLAQTLVKLKGMTI